MSVLGPAAEANQGYDRQRHGSWIDADRASGPEDRLPPANRRRYLEIWVSLKHRWRLSVDPVERAALLRQADRCPDNRLTVPRS